MSAKDDPTPDSRKQSRRTMPGKNGGTLVVGGTKGGRTPDEFKRRMREIASSDAALKFLEECATGVHGAQFAVKAQEYVAERGYGKVPQAITGEDGGPITVKILGEAE